MQKVLNLILEIKQGFHIIKFIIAQMSGFKFYSMSGFLLRKKCEKCIAFSRFEFALQTRAFQGYVRTSCYLHSFATLRNWLRQPLQSLPRFKTEKLEIELNSFSKYITYFLYKKEQKYINTKFYI